MFFEVSSFESMARTVRVSTYGNWVQEFDKAHRREHKSDDVAISLSFLTDSNCRIGSLQQSARYQRSMCRPLVDRLRYVVGIRSLHRFMSSVSSISLGENRETLLVTLPPSRTSSRAIHLVGGASPSTTSGAG